MMAAKSSRPQAVFAAAVLAVGLVAAGCKTDATMAARYAPPPPPKDFSLRPSGPSHYLDQSSRWIERGAGGVDRAILNGRRVEIKGSKILSSAGGDPDVDSAAAMPA